MDFFPDLKHVHYSEITYHEYMEIDFKNLNSNELELLRKRFNEFTFKQDFTFIYERQIPTAAVILIEGEIILKRNKSNTFKIIPPGFVIGLPNLLKNKPFKFNCGLRGTSSVLLLPKYDIFDILSNKKSPLYSLLSTIID